VYDYLDFPGHKGCLDTLTRLWYTVVKQYCEKGDRYCNDEKVTSVLLGEFTWQGFVSATAISPFFVPEWHL